jgi:hypothetical protein
MRKARTTAVLLALVLALGTLLSACGNSDDDEAAQNISDFLVKAQKSPDLVSRFFVVKRKEADCIGKGLVDKIGTDQLQDYGLLDKNNKVKGSVTQLKMAQGDAKAATGVLFGCTDVVAMMKKATSASGTVPKNLRPCVDKTITEDNLRVLFTHIFEGDQDAARKDFVQPMTKCALGSKGQ